MLKLLFLKKKKLKKLKNAKLLVLLTFINLLMYDYYITFFAYLSIGLLKKLLFFIFLQPLLALMRSRVDMFYTVK